MNQIPEKLLKPYDPKETEERIYKAWENGGFFNPEACIEKGYTATDAKPYTIVLPPPNVTGILHMGHALMLAVEDMLIRYHRMKGDRTLWIPGTDHAAIATQSKVEKEISKKEGKSRYDLGREEMLKRIGTFAQESHDTIANQVRRMGASVDWSREAFTLDAKRNLAVRTAFKNMYDDGLIYRGDRIVNWDPKGQTTISDDEIVYETRKAVLYTFKYSKDFPIPISTTRPETKVGDTAVAVHPEDERYKEYVGKEYKVNFAGVPLNIKIVADKAVEKDFGTGALGVTPAHSMIDWEIAKKNNLPIIQVINEKARMIIDTPELKDKKTTEAREIVAKWLRDEGLMIEEKEVEQNISTAERTGGIVEPLPKKQWFIAVNKEFVIKDSKIDGIKSGSKTTLKEIMRKTVESNQIKIIPDYFNKTYFHWIDNLGDWCISRQIWYGHRIPVWYKKTGESEEVFCGIDSPAGGGWEQDSDTLDTWFSSGLWTFSTLGWPEKTKDLEIYHPTNVLETGHEIIFFWVARMILMTGYNIGNIPFHTVYLHGTVRDAKGRKMSKSLGNGIDPIEISDKYGADAARMALIMSGSAGTDSKLSEDKIKGYKHFANKIWNIARFVLSNTTDMPEDAVISKDDQQLIDTLNTQVADITKDIEEYRFFMAGEKIYHYIWQEFADVILEQSKPMLSGTDISVKNSRQKTLLTILNTSLKILHPFMPFVTEELWSFIPNQKMLIVENWPIMK